METPIAELRRKLGLRDRAHLTDGEVVCLWQDGRAEGHRQGLEEGRVLAELVSDFLGRPWRPTGKGFETICEDSIAFRENMGAALAHLLEHGELPKEAEGE